jgi:dephospho-CoA kinase
MEADKPPMLVVGLTGNIASGKSTVAQLLSERGATIIDADVLARRAVELGTPAFEKIVRRWGTSVLAPDGHLDRGALRRAVFGDQQQLEELNRIVHPEVERLRQRLLEEARQRGDRIVVCDIPLLFEKHMAHQFDRIILVDAPRPLRLERLVRDRDLRETEAMDMIAAQMPAELKRAGTDFIIENDGTLNSLEQRVSDVWTHLVSEADERLAAGV